MGLFRGVPHFAHFLWALRGEEDPPHPTSNLSFNSGRSQNQHRLPSLRVLAAPRAQSQRRGLAGHPQWACCVRALTGPCPPCQHRPCGFVYREPVSFAARIVVAKVCLFTRTVERLRGQSPRAASPSSAWLSPAHRGHSHLRAILSPGRPCPPPRPPCAGSPAEGCSGFVEYVPTPAADLTEPSGVFALCVAELGRVWPRHGGLGSATAKEHGLGAFEAAPARRGPGQPQLSWPSTSLSWATIRTPRPS